MNWRCASRETTPPFVPVALYADEPVHDPIIANRIGCYWNIVIGYVIGSGIFPPGKQTLLRLRVPDGWRLASAQVADQTLQVDDRGTVDISSFKGKATLHFQAKPLSPP